MTPQTHTTDRPGIAALAAAAETARRAWALNSDLAAVNRSLGRHEIAAAQDHTAHTAYLAARDAGDRLFWEAELADRTNAYVIGGGQYRVYPDPKPADSCLAGYGGAEFCIRTHDGRVVLTRNLWRQGAIHPAYRGLLPDDAEFIDPPTIHACPEGDDALTPCCARSPHELLWDRMTVDADLVTCRRATAANRTA